MREKGLILPLVLGAVALSAVVTSTIVYFLLKPELTSQSQPVSTPTQARSEAKLEEEGNWSTYRNEKFSYEIKYPKDWEVTEAKPRIGNKPEWTGAILIDNEVQKVTFTEGGEHMWPGEFEVKLLSNPDQLLLDEWAKNYKIESAAGVNLARQTGDTTLSGKPAKMFSIFSFDRHEAAIATTFRGNVYHLRFDSENPNDPEFERHKEIYNQMASSFKFLE